MDGSKSGPNQKLRNLKRGEGSLDGIGYAEAQCGDGVVGVLRKSATSSGRGTGACFTIMAWIPELTSTNIQIGGDMKRMPAHMDSIAPAWWYFCKVVLRLPLARIMAVSRTS